MAGRAPGHEAGDAGLVGMCAKSPPAVRRRCARAGEGRGNRGTSDARAPIGANKKNECAKALKYLMFISEIVSPCGRRSGFGYRCPVIVPHLF